MNITYSRIWTLIFAYPLHMAKCNTIFLIILLHLKWEIKEVNVKPLGCRSPAIVIIAASAVAADDVSLIDAAYLSTHNYHM